MSVVLLMRFHGGMENAVKCWGSFLMNTSEAGVCPCLITIQHVHGLGTMQSCGPKPLWVIYWQYQVTDHAFADDAVVLAELLEILVMTLCVTK